MGSVEEAGAVRWAKDGHRWRALSAAAVLLSCLVDAARADDLFEVVEIRSSGRTVAAEIVDLNGDGRGDLLAMVAVGMPPDERRLLRVFLQGEEGSFPRRPSIEKRLPDGTAAYDIADVLAAPGTELVLLRYGGITVVSAAAADGAEVQIEIPGGTVGAAADERGLESVQLVWQGIAPRPVFLIPQLGSLTVASTDGQIGSVLEVGGRANYFVPPRGSLWFVESDVQLFFDSPHIASGDVDGDGRADIVSSDRHHLRVFLQRPDGHFGPGPDRLLPLKLLSPEDHMRGSGGVSAQARDVNGDARLDLLISHVHGGFSDARTVSTLHLNRGGAWDLAKPDQTFDAPGRVGSDVLVDLNSDGRPELAGVGIPFSVVEFVEALLTRSIDAQISLRRFAGGRFADDPYAEMKLGVPISFDTFRSKGFLPSMAGDFDGDGIMDLLTSGSGDRIEVYPGGSDKPYRRRAIRQDIDTRSRAAFGDVNGDGRTDVLLFDPQRPDASLRLARNRGTLANPRQREKS